MTQEPVRKVLRLYLLTALLIATVLGAIEIGVRSYYSGDSTGVTESVSKLMQELPHRRISGREIGNQMLVHNVALFSQYPNPASITTAYVGTSRSKVLRPDHFGISGAVVGAGNSYSEISYGLLLQAEILRLRFPHLRRVYVETSMLLRRPAHLILEEDHRQYLPLLRSIKPLCDQLGREAPCQRVFGMVQTASQARTSPWKLKLLDKRAELRLSRLFTGGTRRIPVMEDPLFAAIQPNGERKLLPEARTREADQVPDVSNDNIKVQRLRDIAASAPWDGLFDLVALWGQQHGIQVVFFQPPVRADTYRFQLRYGLAQHVADLERISQQYRIPFINLDISSLGYIDDRALFSDEDHMETCVGSGLLTLALARAMEKFTETGTLEPQVPRQEIEARYKRNLAICRLSRRAENS